MTPSRIVAVVFGLGCAWMLMQAVHELGHVLGAWATGGSVQRVVLHPLKISRTDVAPNPAPLAVAWAGPMIGVGLPLIVAAGCRATRCTFRRHAEFFAGFCLVANGAYIGVGSLQGIGDAGDMLRDGSPIWVLISFGMTSVAAGLWMWHRLTARTEKRADTA